MRNGRSELESTTITCSPPQVTKNFTQASKLNLMSQTGHNMCEVTFVLRVHDIAWQTITWICLNIEENLSLISQKCTKICSRLLSWAIPVPVSSYKMFTGKKTVVWKKPASEEDFRIGTNTCTYLVCMSHQADKSPWTVNLIFFSVDLHGYL